MEAGGAGGGWGEAGGRTLGQDEANAGMRASTPDSLSGSRPLTTAAHCAYVGSACLRANFSYLLISIPRWFSSILLKDEPYS